MTDMTAEIQVTAASEYDRLLQFQGGRSSLVVVLIIVTDRKEFFFIFYVFFCSGL